MLTRNPVLALTALTFAAVLAPGRPASAQPVPFVGFKAEEIDKSLKIGYGLVIANVNDDDKPDVVVADADRVVWFENPSWKPHTVIRNEDAKVKTDNVCIDVYDIDGDGRLDIALGAEWQPNNTVGGGSLQWLKQPTDGSTGPWQVFKIADSIPTLHRVHFADLDGDGGAELYVGPLKGPRSTIQKNWSDVGAPLIRYRIPNTPASAEAKWRPEVLTDQLHVMHNFLPVTGGDWTGVLTASYEGVSHVRPGQNGGKWRVTPIGAGNQDAPNGSRGSSEVRLGKFRDDTPMIATIEPFHGNQVVVYTPPAGTGKFVVGAGDAPPALWQRTVLDDTLTGGHAVWCADLDGDGHDEVVAGWREGPKPGINIYKAALAGDGGGAQAAEKADGKIAWQKHVLDEGGIACEDLACFDMNADSKLDIIACGRATKNVRIYWNQGPAK